jgi:hypothetical protein
LPDAACAAELPCAGAWLASATAALGGAPNIPILLVLCVLLMVALSLSASITQQLQRCGQLLAVVCCFALLYASGWLSQLPALLSLTIFMVILKVITSLLQAKGSRLRLNWLPEFLKNTDVRVKTETTSKFGVGLLWSRHSNRKSANGVAVNTCLTDNPWCLWQKACIERQLPDAVGHEQIRVVIPSNPDFQSAGSLKNMATRPQTRARAGLTRATVHDPHSQAFECPCHVAYDQARVGHGPLPVDLRSVCATRNGGQGVKGSGWLMTRSLTILFAIIKSCIKMRKAVINTATIASMQLNSAACTLKQPEQQCDTHVCINKATCTVTHEQTQPRPRPGSGGGGGGGVADQSTSAAPCRTLAAVVIKTVSSFFLTNCHPLISWLHLHSRVILPSASWPVRHFLASVGVIRWAVARSAVGLISRLVRLHALSIRLSQRMRSGRIGKLVDNNTSVIRAPELNRGVSVAMCEWPLRPQPSRSLRDIDVPLQQLDQLRPAQHKAGPEGPPVAQDPTPATVRLVRRGGPARWLCCCFPNLLCSIFNFAHRTMRLIGRLVVDCLMRRQHAICKLFIASCIASLLVAVSQLLGLSISRHAATALHSATIIAFLLFLMLLHAASSKRRVVATIQRHLSIETASPSHNGGGASFQPQPDSSAELDSVQLQTQTQPMHLSQTDPAGLASPQAAADDPSNCRPDSNPGTPSNSVRVSTSLRDPVVDADLESAVQQCSDYLHTLLDTIQADFHATPDQQLTLTCWENELLAGRHDQCHQHIVVSAVDHARSSIHPRVALGQQYHDPTTDAHTRLRILASLPEYSEHAADIDALYHQFSSKLFQSVLDPQENTSSSGTEPLTPKALPSTSDFGNSPATLAEEAGVPRHDSSPPVNSSLQSPSPINLPQAVSPSQQPCELLGSWLENAGKSLSLPSGNPLLSPTPSALHSAESSPRCLPTRPQSTSSHTVQGSSSAPCAASDVDRISVLESLVTKAQDDAREARAAAIQSQSDVAKLRDLINLLKRAVVISHNRAKEQFLAQSTELAQLAARVSATELRLAPLPTTPLQADGTHQSATRAAARVPTSQVNQNPTTDLVPSPESSTLHPSKSHNAPIVQQQAPKPRSRPGPRSRPVAAGGGKGAHSP